MPPKSAKAKAKAKAKTESPDENLRYTKATFYCVMCRKKVETVPTGMPSITKSGSWMIHGTCEECSTPVHTFVSEKTLHSFDY